MTEIREAYTFDILGVLVLKENAESNTDIGKRIPKILMIS